MGGLPVDHTRTSGSLNQFRQQIPKSGIIGPYRGAGPGNQEVAMMKTLSIRLPEALHRAARETAEQNQQSLNSLLQEALERYLREAEDQQLFDSYSRLGEEPGECDVEFA